MTINRMTILLLVALVCFLIALLLAVDVINGGNYPAWIAGGLASFVAAHLP